MKDLIAKLTLLEGQQHSTDVTASAQRVNEGVKYTPETPYGIQYRVFAGKDQRLTTKVAWFNTALQLEKAEIKIRDLGNFYEIIGHHYPEDMAKESTYESSGADEFSGSGSGRPYVCVHVRKGKCEVTANSSYEAVKKAAQKWGLKNTAGIDAYLADITHDASGIKESAPRGSTEPLQVGNEVRSRNPNNGSYGMPMVVRKIEGNRIYCSGKNLQTMPYQRGQLELLNPPGIKESALTKKPNSKKHNASALKEVRTVYDPITRKNVPVKPIKQKMGGPVTKNGKLINIPPRDKPSDIPFSHDDRYQNESRREDNIKTNEDNYSDIHNIVTGQKRHKGKKTLSDKIADWFWGFDGRPKNAVTTIRYLQNFGLSDNEINQVRDIANQAGKTALDYVARKFKVPEQYLSSNLKSNFIVYAPFINAGSEVEDKWRNLTNTLMLPKLRKQLGNGVYGVEPVKEVSSKTLGNYIDRASDELDSAAWNRGVASSPEGSWRAEKEAQRVSDKRLKGIKLAAKKLSSKSVKEDIMKRQTVKESILTEDPGLEKVLRHFGKEVSNFLEYSSLDDHLYNALYDYWFDEMPYSVKKSRGGDPYEWIEEKLHDELGGTGAYRQRDEHSFSGVGAFGEGAAGDSPVGYSSGNDISPVGSTEELDEGRMSEVDVVMQEIANGNKDIYAVINHPIGPEEEEASKILQDMFDDVVVDTRLHPDDDFEAILDIVADRIAAMYEGNADLEEGEGSSGYDWHQQMSTQASRPAISTNPALSAKIAAAKAAARASMDTEPTGGAMAAPVLKRPGQPAVGEAIDEELDETFLVEGLEPIITEILEEVGLDHGLDFFFDNGLVAIGKSTARVIINTLKADPRIKAVPSFGRIDGEEVQIVFNKQPKKPVKDIDIRDIEPAEFDSEGPNRLGESEVNEDVTLSINAEGEDALNVMRRLSGLPEATPIANDEPEAEVSSEEEMEEAEEGEYVNAPDPTVHTSTTDMINRGNDLNKPKRQDFTIRNLGNNPMAEARKLFKQYEALKDDIKK